MKALQIDTHGPIANLRVRDVNEPGLGADDVRVAIEAAAINPSDLASAKGAFLGAPLPRILGRDFAGTVIDGPPELVGARVWGSGGDLGISRDGTHAESIVIPRAAVAVRPTNLTAEQAAAVGVPYVTAWAALDLAGVRAGETVLVAGAAGAVGTAAIQLAHVRGAHVVAVTHNTPPSETAQLVTKVEDPTFLDQVRGVTGGRGCDVALNGVGASVFDALLAALPDGGRMVTYSVAGGRNATVDLFTQYRRRISLLGLNTIVVDVVAASAIMRALTPLFENGSLHAPAVSDTFALSEAPRAYEAAQRGARKVVLGMR